MKKFAGVIMAVLTLILCFTLSACGTRYSSNYSSKLMIRKHTSNNASVSFDSFKGMYVMKFQNKGDGEAFITYEAALREGNIKAYYDFNGEKLDLFKIGAYGVATGRTEAFTGDKTVYVIIESDGETCGGSFSFALEKATGSDGGFKAYAYDGGGITGYSEQTSFPMGTRMSTGIFNSYEEFAAYRAEVNEIYNDFIENCCNGIESNGRYKSYMRKLNSYDASYFGQSFLIIIHKEECSGSYKLSVKSPEFNGTEAAVTIGRRSPESGISTCDMHDWSFIIESEKTGEISHVSVEFVDDGTYKL